MEEVNLPTLDLRAGDYSPFYPVDGCLGIPPPMFISFFSDGRYLLIEVI